MNQFPKATPISEKESQTPLIPVLLVELAFILLVLIIALALSSVGHAQENSSALSVGYRMGLLTKFSYKGYSMKSWEGQLMLGSNSSMYDGINPWSFSIPEE